MQSEEISLVLGVVGWGAELGLGERRERREKTAVGYNPQFNFNLWRGRVCASTHTFFFFFLRFWNCLVKWVLNVSPLVRKEKGNTHRSLPGLVQARYIRKQAQNKTGDTAIIRYPSQKKKNLCLALKCETSRGGCRF